MSNWHFGARGLVDRLWTIVTLGLAVIIALPAVMIVAAPFIKGEPTVLYDRFGCPERGFADAVERSAGCAIDQAGEPEQPVYEFLEP